ncbi:MerR family transcriptional regulator [Clostridium sp. YIM B02506]|uniref:MerR family transcriptional regulator n=1 Tax=Clostridium sp. YIM B02506 TaxID=2910680 RepID=UPI001EED3FB8|nr:MerR family transcriptional regulator [Clostridium sp. YIM B02506]
MLIREVSKETNLTKKAIEYYCEHGLVNPEVLENGYRDFSSEDVEALRKISLYRRLGLNIADIKAVLKNQKLLQDVVYRKSLELDRQKEKQEVLKKLSNGSKLEDVEKEINSITYKSTILEKLLDMFPSYFGRFFSMNFSYYLKGTIETEEQKQAFEEIIEFLDNSPNLKIPKDLQDYLDEYTDGFSENDISKMIQSKEENIKDYEKFIEDNKEILKEYIEYKKTDEFKNSPANKLAELTKEFCKTSGDYDKFIPDMRKLSSEYNKYQGRLLEVNEKFIKDYPETKNW